MKAFVPNETTSFDYPEEMEEILAYLQDHGKLNIKPTEVERLYRAYSEEKWCAGWVTISLPFGGVSYEILESFANYLAEIDV